MDRADRVDALLTRINDAWLRALSRWDVPEMLRLDQRIIAIEEANGL